MANLKLIKKRIASVKNTQKITKAMKMVAAAKLRRAQTAVTSSRPFLNKMQEVVHELIQKLSTKDKPVYLQPHKTIKKVRVTVVSSNKGLCGGFNSNLLRQSEKFLRELKDQGKIFELFLIGKKANEYFTARRYKINNLNTAWADAMSFEEAAGLCRQNVEDYKNNHIDECYFVYNKFTSAISQVPTIEKLLPVESSQKTEKSFGIDYIYEPSQKAILDDLLPRFLASKVQMFHKESLASELGARMAAMDSATKNASEMIDGLTLQYNRARQAAITMELLDIVNGSESLNG